MISQVGILLLRGSPARTAACSPAALPRLAELLRGEKTDELEGKRASSREERLWIPRGAAVSCSSSSSARWDSCGGVEGGRPRGGATPEIISIILLSLYLFFPVCRDKNEEEAVKLDEDGSTVNASWVQLVLAALLARCRCVHLRMRGYGKTRS